MTTFNIYQRENLDQPVELIAEDVILNEYKIYGLTKGKKYLFSVGAVRNQIEKISDEELILAGDEWTPLDLSTVFILDDESSILNSGSLLTLWSSRSSQYSFGQSINSSKPEIIENGLNSKRTIRFDGINDAIFNNTIELRSSISNKNFAAIFSVFKHNLISNSGVLSAITTSDGSSRITIGGDSSNINIYARRLDSDQESSSSSEFQNGWNMMLQLIDYSTGTLKTYLNGSLSKESTSFVSSGNVSQSESSRPLTIGAYPDASGDNPIVGACFSCDIASYMLFNSEISSDDIDKLFGYSAHKYYLTDKLPSSHPYKVLVPTI